MFQSKKIEELTERIQALETDLATAQSSLTAIAAERDSARTQLAEAATAHADAIAQLKDLHAAALATQKSEHEASLQTAITDALASAGVPETNLPSRASSTTDGESIEDLTAAMKEESDPAKKGEMALKLRGLRAKAAAAASAAKKN